MLPYFREKLSHKKNKENKKKSYIQEDEGWLLEKTVLWKHRFLGSEIN